jgi:NDP-sugar pyrophosphorylase family protein
MSKRVVILAGGMGTRLRPFTVTIPKPLVPVGSAPVLDILVRQLASHGFDHITLAISEHSRLIRAFFGDGSEWSVKIDYSIESQPLSTMGPLKLIKDLPETFLVMNGDVLTDFNFSECYDEHNAEKRLFTIASHRRTQTIDYGVLESHEGILTGFEEKPSVPFEVSMGIYLVDRRVLSFIPDGRPFGFDDLMRTLLERNERVHIKPFSGYWKDIGRPDDYEEATNDIDHLTSRLFSERKPVAWSDKWQKNISKTAL